jgi:putative oxidoreductase
MSDATSDRAETLAARWARIEPWARDAGLLLLRAGLGGMMLVHGIPKVTGFAERSATFPDPMGVGSELSMVLAIFGEVVCSVLLVLGLGTRIAAVPFAFTMAVAGLVVHAGDDWDTKEKAMLYLLGGICVALLGPGRASLDHLIAQRKRA